MEMVWDAQCNHYLGLGHNSDDPRGDPRGDFRGGIGDPGMILGVIWY